jgi:integrase
MAWNEPGGSPNNPWRNPFVQRRNELIAKWLLATGARRGEILGLTLPDFDRRTGKISIQRRQDNKRDPRPRQPNAKTLSRSAMVNENLIVLGERYLKDRREISAARKNDFFFVAVDGSPLSLSSVTEMFVDIRRRHPELGDISAHTLRHTWNEMFSDKADRLGLTETEEADTRRVLMGWANNSKMPALYTRRRTRALADKTSLEMQDEMMNFGTKDEKISLDTKGD